MLSSIVKGVSIVMDSEVLGSILHFPPLSKPITNKFLLHEARGSFMLPALKILTQGHLNSKGRILHALVTRLLLPMGEKSTSTVTQKML